jgi:hypothetical protein
MYSIFGNDASDTDAAAKRIGERARQMSALKQVPNSVAQELLKGGQAAINQARTIGANLPGGTARDNVYWKLQWHQNNLALLKIAPFEMYPSADDLKKWVEQAYIELDVAQYGAAYADRLWAEMWAEIATALANLPAAVAAKVGQTTNALLSNAFGIPVWLLALLGAGVGLVAYRVVKR